MARRPQTFEEIRDLAVLFARGQIGEKIRPEAAALYGITMAVLLAFGIPLPQKISGFRTLEQQAALRRIRAVAGGYLQPAQYSWHTVGLAFDFDTRSPGLSAFAFVWRRLGGRVGSDFSSPDPGHFDSPVAGIEPQAAF